MTPLDGPNDDGPRPETQGRGPFREIKTSACPGAVGAHSLRRPLGLFYAARTSTRLIVDGYHRAATIETLIDEAHAELPTPELATLLLTIRTT